jgi:hypothetical protein
MRTPCDLAIADQFGDERYIKQALMAMGRQVRLLQTPKAERAGEGPVCAGDGRDGGEVGVRVPEGVLTRG